MGQAALGIEIVADNDRIREIAMSLNDEDTFVCTKVERDFISVIGAGCSAPVAVNAVIVETEEGKGIAARAMIGYPDGTHILHESVDAPLDEADILGDMLAQRMIERGALDILENAEKIAFKDEMPERL
jgi:hydroxymethylbilane synthase